MKKIFSLLIAVIVTLSFCIVAFAEDAVQESNYEIMPLANEQYLYDQNVEYEQYSDLFTLSGSKLTSYYSVGASAGIDYVTIKLYEETAPSYAGRKLIASKKVYTGTTSTLFFKDKSITAGANYRLHVIPHFSSSNLEGTRVIVSLVSW